MGWLSRRRAAQAASAWAAVASRNARLSMRFRLYDERDSLWGAFATEGEMETRLAYLREWHPTLVVRIEDTMKEN